MSNDRRAPSRRPKLRRISRAPEGASEMVTVRPPFDPQEFARQSERATLPPPPEVPRTTSDAPELMSVPMEVVWPVEPTTVPELIMAREDLEWFELPQEALQLLPHIDGKATVEAICAQSGVEITIASDLIEEMVREGIVTTR